MSVKERFISYVQIDTQSDPETGTHPSTAKQFDLARKLEAELKALGASSVRCDKHCYVYAEIPANVEGFLRSALSPTWTPNPYAPARTSSLRPCSIGAATSPSPTERSFPKTNFPF